MPFVKKKEFIQIAPKTLDFVGVNYYTRMYGHWNIKNKYFIDIKKSPFEHNTDMPFTMYPEGLMQVFELANKLGKKMIVTENGISTDDENLRKLFIYKHISLVIRAMKKYNIIGYMYWSLIDNFEWCEGYSQHFGLCSFDKVTYERNIKPAGFLYKKLLYKLQK
jgi:beta-glucosidase/6-phospho-beta-glucosidase/beta-galactosidase